LDALLRSPDTNSCRRQTFTKTEGTRNKGSASMRWLDSTEKGKAIPLQAWTGPEGSRRLRLPDFKAIST